MNKYISYWGLIPTVALVILLVVTHSGKTVSLTGDNKLTVLFDEGQVILRTDSNGVSISTSIGNRVFQINQKKNRSDPSLNLFVNNSLGSAYTNGLNSILYIDSNSDGIPDTKIVNSDSQTKKYIYKGGLWNDIE